MGYGLPAAIGAAFANPGKEIRLITGDGGLQLNIQEMGTVEHHKLPITIYLFNNHSHGMCVQTQRQWMGSVYPSTSMDGGYHCPNLAKIAQAYGVNLVEFEIPFGEELTPCVVAWHPNEDAYPYLSKEELKNQMLIPLWEKS